MSLGDVRGRLGIALIVLSLLIVPLATTSVGATTNATAEPVLEVENAETTVDSSTSITLRLSNAPNGVAGFDLTVALADSSTGTITGISFADSYPMTNSSIQNGGKSAYISAVDLDGEYESGASDVPLATVTIEGSSAGETALEVTQTNIDNDNGDNVAPTLTTGTLTVTGDSSDGAPSSGTTTTESSDSTNGTDGQNGGQDDTTAPTGDVNVTDTTDGAVARVQNVDSATTISTNFSGMATNNSVGISNVNLNLASEPSDFRVEASEPTTTAPDTVPSVEGATAYFNVTTSNLTDSAVTSGSLTVTVDPANVPSDGVQLYHYTAGNWKALETTQTGQYEYTADVSGFSPFAIGPPANQEGGDTTVTTTTATAETTTEGGDAETTRPPETSTETGILTPGFGFLTTLIAAASLLGYLVLGRR